MTAPNSARGPRFFEASWIGEEDPWLEGYEAQLNLTPRTANPYKPRGEWFALWDAGWIEAHEDSETRSAIE